MPAIDPRLRSEAVYPDYTLAYPDFTYTDFIRESNVIEGIHRDPTDTEVAGITAFVRLLRPPSITELQALCYTFQHNGHLRNRLGMDVRVGGHYPIKGGEEVVAELRTILDGARDRPPFDLYTEFEWLHPFMDGNGRTGRALWLWRMGGRPQSFLRSFHYQTLQYMDRVHSRIDQ